MGLIYFEMLYRNESYVKGEIFEQLENGIFPSDFEYENEVQFIKIMLRKDPTERATANDILLRLLPYNKCMTAQVNAIVDQLVPH
jgi:hypothetical protein